MTYKQPPFRSLNMINGRKLLPKKRIYSIFSITNDELFDLPLSYYARDYRSDIRLPLSFITRMRSNVAGVERNGMKFMREFNKFKKGNCPDAINTMYEISPPDYINRIDREDFKDSKALNIIFLK